MTRLEDLEHRLTEPNQANQRTDPIGMDSLRKEVEALSTAIAEYKINPTEGLANDVRLLRSDVNRLLERWSPTSPHVSEPIGQNQTTHTETPNDRQRHARPSGHQKSSRRLSAKPPSMRSYNSGIRRPPRDYEDTTSSEDDANEYATSDEDEEPPTIPFFQREKGPKYPGLSSLHPSDPLFDRLMSYRYYRLMRTSRTRSSATTGVIRKQIKNLELILKDHKFSGEDPIMVFDFLTRFVEEADTIGMSEGQAFVALPHFLTGTASQQFRASKNSSRSGGVSSWPEAVQYFIRTYATPATLREAVEQLRNLKQGVNETEMDFATRINQAAYRCGNVHDEVDKMTYFVNGLLPEIQPRVMRFREDQPRYELTFERLVQFARDEGLAVRAQTSRARTVKITTAPTPLRAVAKPKPSREVHFMEPQYAASTIQETNQGEQLFLLPEESVATSQLPSTDSLGSTEREKEGEQLFHAERERPKQIGNTSLRDTPNRVGWIKPSKLEKLICFSCYAFGHTSPGCNVSLADVEQVIKNYEALNPDQKARVPDKTHRMAKAAISIFDRPETGTPPNEEKLGTNNPQSKN